MTAEGLPLAALEQVSLRYDGLADPVLRGIDFEVNGRDALAIVGPSGSGKSTLLNLLGGLLPPTDGTVRFEGKSLAELDADALAALRNTAIGFVFQAHHLLPHCTALENVLVPTLVHPDAAHRESARARAEELLAAVGLADRLHHAPAALSGGECQRVAVVRALINRPRLVLADEPTGSLDQRRAAELGELMGELREREAFALVTVTHSDSLATRMDRVLRLEDGVLQPAELSA